VTIEEEKLRYLHTELEELRKKERSEPGLIHRALPFFPPILGALLFLVLKKRRDRTDTKMARARKTARARLKDAEKALKEGDRARFHEELYKGLRSHISERTGIPPSDLSKERIREKMKGIEIPDGLIQKTLRTLEHSEMLRYAPSSNVSDEEVHEETVSLLTELESYWK
jgi:HEPN domain-containing protein